MSRFLRYYARFDDVRGDLNGLPSWARTVFLIVSLPGIVLVALSILAFVVSVVALLLVAVPVYVLLRTATRPAGEDQSGLTQVPNPWRRETKHVDVTVRDPATIVPDEVNGE